MSASRLELVSTTLSLVASFDPRGDQRSAESRTRTMQLLLDTADPFSRDSFDPGHMTASAVVLSPDRTRMVLVYHVSLARWLQPGGHVEPCDDDLVFAARREVEEETNLSLAGVVDAPLVGVDVHEIPAVNGEPPHLHHDLAFVLVLKTDQSVEPGHDQQAAWCPIDRLDSYGVDSPLRTSLTRALHDSGLSVGPHEDL